MGKEKKVFVKCSACGASVRDCNLGTHNAVAHGITIIGGVEEQVDAKNPSSEDKRKLSVVYCSKARELSRLKKLKEAKVLLRKAIEYDERNIEAYLSLVEVFEQGSHQCTEIETLLKKALKMEPESKKTVCRMAEHLCMHQKFGQAAELLKTVKNATEDPEIVQEMAVDLMYAGRMNEAKELLVTELPKLREKLDAGPVERSHYLELNTLLLTLILNRPDDIVEKTGTDIALKLTSFTCSRCPDGEEMEIERIIEKKDATTIEAKCAKCGNTTEISNKGVLHGLGALGYFNHEPKNQSIVSLEVLTPPPDALLEVKFVVRGEEFLTAFAYTGTPPGETLELVRKSLATATHAMDSGIPEGKVIIFKRNEFKDVPSGFSIRNPKDEMERIIEFLGGLKTAYENSGNYSEKERLLARTNRLDFGCDYTDATDADLAERIGISRRLAIISRANGMEERAEDYLRKEREILEFVRTQKTGYEDATIEEMLLELETYDGEEAELPPEGLLLEITKRGDCSPLLLGVIRDPGNWGVNIWRAAMNSMYLIGAIGDAKIIPGFLSTVSELETKDLLGDTVTEELVCILAAFGREGASALATELKNTQHHEWVRVAIANALTTIALLCPEKRGDIVEAFKEIVSADASPVLVAFAVSGLCALQAEESIPIIKRAFADNRVEEGLSIAEEDLALEMETPDLERDYFNACRHPLELLGAWEFDTRGEESEEEQETQAY
ncbi:DUF1186 domain-containing protein [Candidatus Micrarchaeota archaeon]|nr:DUF1186 domain-containing protein [Candidatus Micrarchaeota archaeon]